MGAPQGHRNRRILDSGSKTPDKGASRNRGFVLDSYRNGPSTQILVQTSNHTYDS